MDILKGYGALWNYKLDLIPHKVFTPEPKVKRKYVAPEVTPITLATQDFRTRDYITAHDLRDYRRTTFNMVLLPNVDLPYDVIAKEVYGL